MPKNKENKEKNTSPCQIVQWDPYTVLPATDWENAIREYKIKLNSYHLKD